MKKRMVDRLINRPVSSWAASKARWGEHTWTCLHTRLCPPVSPYGASVRAVCSVCLSFSGARVWRCFVFTLRFTAVPQIHSSSIWKALTWFTEPFHKLYPNLFRTKLCWRLLIGPFSGPMKTFKNMFERKCERAKFWYPRCCYRFASCVSKALSYQQDMICGIIRWYR